jgi:hypothetical protein
MHCFTSVFMCFHYVFTAETCTLRTFHLYTKIHIYHIFYMKCTVLLVFSCVFIVFLLQKHEFFVHFKWIYLNTHVPYILHEMHCFASVFTVFLLQKHIPLVHITYIYKNTHVPYILHEMHCFASVFMCFHYVLTAETCTFGTFHLYTKIHMYDIFYMNCTVSLVFFKFSPSFYCRNMNFWYISLNLPKYTCTIYSTWNALLCLCFHVFSLCFHCRNMYFWYISHIYIKIHIYHIFYMKCTVFLVFSCVFTVFSLQKHELLVDFTWIYQITHVSYILREINFFASVFICLHNVFTA